MTSHHGRRADARRASRRPRGRLIAILAALAASLIPTVPASAGTYWVHTCRVPNGAAAGIDGWTPSSSGAWVGATENCGAGGALEARLDANIGHNSGDHAAWTWTPPANTSLASWQLSRAAVAGPDQAYGSPGYGLDTPAGNIESCLRYYGCSAVGDINASGAGSNGLSGFNAGAAWFRMIVTCGGGGACAAGDTRGKLFAARFELLDNQDPVPTGATGQLTQPGTHGGIENLAFNATDLGGGVYRGLVLVDGNVVSSEVLDPNGGACGDQYPAGGGENDFTSRVPCKLSKSANLAFDTRTVSDHQHTLEVRVTDATGTNYATVFGPNTITIDNVPAPSNTAAPTQAGTAKVNRTFLAGNGSWDDHGIAGEPAYTYQWTRCVPNGGACSPIDGATGQTYDATEGDLGYQLRVLVTATNSEGATSAQSDRSATVATEAGTIPACADGIDNDADGKSDDEDADCDSRGDADEATPLPADPCAGQPAGLKDPCGDNDGDGTKNKDDSDDDNDGVADASDPDPFDATKPNGSNTTTTTATTTTTTSASDTSRTSTVVGGAVNGSGGAAGSARFDASSRRTVKMRFNEAKTVTGKLADAGGRSIENASVDVLEQIAKPGAAFARVGTVVTNRDGVYSYRVAGGPSRTLRFAYASRLGETEYRDTADVLVKVSAVLVVSAAKRNVSRGQTMRLKGRLLGAKFLPKKGATLEIQARDGRKWRTIALQAAKQNGKVAYSYRFKRVRRASFLFRVRLRTGAGVPLGGATSKMIRVSVR